MNLRFRPILPPSCLVAFGITLMAGTGAFAVGANRQNPTSKLFVVETAGESQIDNGEKILPLVKSAVHPAEGTVIETKAKATDALVLSNGTALYVGPDTRFEMKRFLQEPFLPDRSDLEIEPSISQTLVKILRGSLGLCTSRLVAGSSMVYQTPHATINIRGRRLLIEVTENETRVSLLEGDVTVLPEGLGTGETLKPGQQVIIHRASADVAPTMKVQGIPESESAKIDDSVTLACLSRRTVYFDTTAQGEVTPVQVVPAKLPTNFTVSPARING